MIAAEVARNVRRDTLRCFAGFISTDLIDFLLDIVGLASGRLAWVVPVTSPRDKSPQIGLLPCSGPVAYHLSFPPFDSAVQLP